MMRLVSGMVPLTFAIGANAQVQDSLSSKAKPPTAERRSDDNAIRQAEDGFGVSIGVETVGIYTINNVRGFSPASANNVRIDGLYFDLVSVLNPRIRRGNNVRVGITALGFAFPAPTGVVDYELRKPSGDLAASLAFGFDSYGATTAEVDATIPLSSDRLSLGLGSSIAINRFNSDTSNIQDMQAAVLRWSPLPRTSLFPFFSRTGVKDFGMSRTYIPAGSYLPPRIKLGRDFGPKWATYAGEFYNYGLTANSQLGGGWKLLLGTFWSEAARERDHFVFLSGITPNGFGRALVIADPPSRIASTSGELRIVRGLLDGSRYHQFSASLRGREASNRYGGGFSSDLGTSSISLPTFAPEPERRFSTQSVGELSQKTIGIAYELQWPQFGEANLGIQKTEYSKRSSVAGSAFTRTRTSPILYNAELAIALNRDFTIYGGLTRGLEESGVAPSNATNRNEVLPAIVTRQQDVGIRWTGIGRLRLIAGMFDIRKPYFNLDSSSSFAQLGDVTNRGIEASLSGPLSKRLDIVFGGMLSRPRVTGYGVSLGRLGSLPVGMFAQRADLNFDWRPAILDGLSFDGTASYTGRITATRDNAVSIPTRTLLDVGLRYRFRLSRNRVLARLQITNVLGHYYWLLRSAGAYVPADGRRVTLRLVSDF